MWKNGWKTARMSQYTNGLAALLPGAAVKRPRDPSHTGVPARPPRVTVALLESRHRPHAHAERSRLRRCRRGCLGAPAAARQARVRLAAYDDVELLGKAVTRGDGWYPVGFALHMPTAPCSEPSTPTSPRRCPCRRSLRGPVVALVEHVALWPLGGSHRPLPPGAQGAAQAVAGTAAPSPRRPGAICCSASCSASSSGALNAEPEPAPPRARSNSRATVTERSSTPSRSSPLPSRGPKGARMRVLITGASGFAGGHLARACSRGRRRCASASRATGTAARGRRHGGSRSTCATPPAVRGVVPRGRSRGRLSPRRAQLRRALVG